MTTQTLEAMFDKNTQKVLSEIKETEKLVKKAIFDRDKYNLRYLKQEEKNYCLEEDILDNVMQELKNEKEKYIGDYIGLSQELLISGGRYEGDSPEMKIRTNYYSYVELTEEQIKKFVEADIKKELEILVFERAKELGSKKTYKTTLDCKMLTLFKTGKIDFDTLSVLTYSDCEI